MRQLIVKTAQNRLRQASCAKREGEALLQVFVIVQPHPLPHLGEEINDLPNWGVHQVRQQQRIPEDHVVDVLVGIRRSERSPASPIKFERAIARHDDPAPCDDGNVVVVRHDHPTHEM